MKAGKNGRQVCFKRPTLHEQNGLMKIENVVKCLIILNFKCIRLKGSSTSETGLIFNTVVKFVIKFTSYKFSSIRSNNIIKFTTDYIL